MYKMAEMRCGSLAEVCGGSTPKNQEMAENRAEVVAEVFAEVAEVVSVTRRKPCGGLRRFAELSPPLKRVRSLALRRAWGAASAARYDTSILR